MSFHLIYLKFLQRMWRISLNKRLRRSAPTHQRAKSFLIWKKVWPNISKHYTNTEGVMWGKQKSSLSNVNCEYGHWQNNVPLIKDINGIRKLTPRECFNLQGFPQTYKFGSLSNSKLYKLAGNAITVPLVKLLAEHILNVVTRKRENSPSGDHSHNNKAEKKENTPLGDHSHDIKAAKQTEPYSRNYSL